MKQTPNIYNGGAIVPHPRITRRQRMFVRRALRLETNAKKLFGKMREAISLALQNGLEVGTPVEIEMPGPDGKSIKKFVRIKNNFTGDVAFKRSYLSRFEIEDVPKYQWPGAPQKKSKPEPATISEGAMNDGETES